MLPAAILAAIVLPFLTPTPAGADWCSRHRSCVQRVEWKRCGQHHPIRCIRYAAMRYHQSTAVLARVARCESRLDPYARNASGASGLFQFLTSTWATTPYAGRSIWSARWSSLAAGWMFSRGRSREWVCY